MGLKADLARHRPLDHLHAIIDQHSHQADDQAALQDEGGIVVHQAGNDDFAQRFGSNGRTDGRGADIDDSGDLQAFDNQRQRKRQFDANRRCQPFMPMPSAASSTEAGTCCNPATVFSKIGSSA